MYWLTIEMVAAFHRESLVRFGGADGLRDAGLLESALARPQNALAYQPDANLFQLAAIYCHGIIKNHPFVDGNKRTGMLAGIAFLAINHIEVVFDEPQIAAMIIALAASEITEDEIAEWFRRSTL